MGHFSICRSLKCDHISSHRLIGAKGRIVAALLAFRWFVPCYWRDSVLTLTILRLVAVLTVDVLLTCCCSDIAMLSTCCCSDIVMLSTCCCSDIVMLSTCYCSDIDMKGSFAVLWTCCCRFVAVFWMCCWRVVAVLWTCCWRVVAVVFPCCRSVVVVLWPAAVLRLPVRSCSCVNSLWDVTQKRERRVVHWCWRMHSSSHQKLFMNNFRVTLLSWVLYWKRHMEGLDICIVNNIKTYLKS